MQKIHRLASAVLAIAALSAGAGPALSQNTLRSINIPPSALAVEAPATQANTVNLPDGNISGFIATFVLPADYINGTTVSLRMQFSAGQPSCTAKLNLAQSLRVRPGFPLQISPVPTSNGITFVGGDTVTFDASGSVVLKRVQVRAPTTGAFTDMLRGDTMVVFIQRLGADAADTCASTLFLQSFEVRYSGS